MLLTTEERLLKDGYALIESNKRKKALITSHDEAVVNLNAIIAKKDETIASQQAKNEEFQAQLNLVIAGNPDLAMMLASRDKEIADLKMQADALRQTATDAEAKLQAEIHADINEDDRIKALLDAEEAILAEDDVIAAPVAIDLPVMPGA